MIWHLIFTALLASVIVDTTCGTYVDLQFDLKLHHSPRACQHLPHGDRCQLRYALTILQGEAGDFELQPVMLQITDIKSTPNSHKHFKEDTVVNLENRSQVAPIERDQHMFIGIKLYGLPTSVQDYFLIDITKILEDKQKSQSMSVLGDDYHFSAKSSMGKLHRHSIRSKKTRSKSCSCSGNECGCCEHILLPKIDLNHTVCENITYLPDDYGLALTVSLDGVVWYNDTVSARNPPPVCFNVPYLKEFASLCVRMVKLTIDDRYLSGCAHIQAELYHVRVAEYELGCFKFPIKPTLSRWDQLA